MALRLIGIGGKSALWSNLWKYLEIVKVVHDLLIVHFQVVEAKGFRGEVIADTLSAGAAGEHRVAHNGGSLHLGTASTGTDSWEKILTLKSIKQLRNCIFLSLGHDQPQLIWRK